MIITRTPYRVSLFGGGTDFPQWLSIDKGGVVSFSIDKYCYLTARELPPFFQHKYRVVYSNTETVYDVDEIKHPAFREGIRLYADSPIEIHHHGDLPARSGIGSSSAFAVGLIHTLWRLKGLRPTQENIAKEAISFEQFHLKEEVGSQDQIATAMGGFNYISFISRKDWICKPIKVSERYIRYLESHFLLFFTGEERISSHISAGLTSNIESKLPYFYETNELTQKALKLIEDESDVGEIAELLEEAWNLKKRMNPLSSTSKIDDLYSACIKEGALAGKILGAGGGGFMLLLVTPSNRDKIMARFRNLIEVPFRIEFSGSQSVENWA